MYITKKKYVFNLYLINWEYELLWFKKKGVICLDQLDAYSDYDLKRFIFEFKLENGDGLNE